MSKPRPRQHVVYVYPSTYEGLHVLARTLGMSIVKVEALAVAMLAVKVIETSGEVSDVLVNLGLASPGLQLPIPGGK